MTYRLIRFNGSDEAWRKQWLEYRKGGLGGSDAPAVLGMSPYATPYTVWLEKTRRTEPDDLSENESVYWGTVLEDDIAKEFAKRHPDMQVRRKRGVMQSADRPWQFATVDRVTIDAQGRHGILEIKTCGAHRAQDWDDGCPSYYFAQPTHYLAVSGYDYFDVAVLIGGQRYREFHYERDEDDIAALNERETEFWEEYVLKDVPPMVTGSKADSEALFEQHMNPTDEYVQMLDEDLPNVRRRIAIEGLVKQYQEEIRQIDNELKALIGDAKGIQTPKRRITWVRSSYSTFDKKKLQEEDPETYQKYSGKKERDGGLRLSDKG